MAAIDTTTATTDTTDTIAGRVVTRDTIRSTAINTSRSTSVDNVNSAASKEISFAQPHTATITPFVIVTFCTQVRHVHITASALNAWRRISKCGLGASFVRENDKTIASAAAGGTLTNDNSLQNSAKGGKKGVKTGVSGSVAQTSNKNLFPSNAIQCSRL